MTGMTIVLSQSGTSRVVVSSGTHKREGDQREREILANLKSCLMHHRWSKRKKNATSENLASAKAAKTDHMKVRH